MYIDNYYLNKLTNIKYPDAVSQYNVTEKATINLIKKFRKELDLNDIMEILEYNPRNGNDKKEFIIKVIKDVYSDLNFKFKEDDLRKISNSFKNMKEFIDFVNNLSNSEIFVGGDLEKNWKWNIKFEDLLTCRSYKIYSITNE
jgi:uncharacterized protein YpuA (DUF1002 family)